MGFNYFVLKTQQDGRQHNQERLYMSLVPIFSFFSFYIVGGADSSGSTLSSVECYDPPTNTWAPKAPLSGGRYGHAVVGMGEELFAIGGYDGSYLKTCERYSLQDNRWVGMGSLSVARRRVRGIVFKTTGGSAWEVSVLLEDV